jgi:hypothetical protein
VTYKNASSVGEDGIREKEIEYWKKDPEYERGEWFRRVSLTMFGATVVLFVVAIVLAIIGISLDRGQYLWTAGGLAALGIALLLLSVLVGSNWTAVYERSMTRMRQELITQSREQVSDALAHLDVVALWNSNQEQIDIYHQIVTNQAKSAYRSAVVAMVVGLILLVSLAGFAATLRSDPAASVILGSLGAIGGAIGAYIAATFLKVHAAATDQLQIFFAQPVEFAKYWGSVPLVEKLEPALRPEAYMYLIKAFAAQKGAVSDRTPSPTLKEQAG